jgi:hypothetical protein
MKSRFRHCAIVVATVMATVYMSAASTVLAQAPPRRGPQHPYHPSDVLKAKSLGPTAGGVVSVNQRKAPKVERRIVDPSRIAPHTGPGPRHAATGSHGIIFVGGHGAAGGSKQALNPQPIPPGRVVRHVPRPGMPVRPDMH